MNPVISLEPQRFTPAHYESREDAPVYMVKPATRRERIAFRAALTAQGLRIPRAPEIAAAIRAGASQVMTPDALGTLQETLDRMVAGVELEQAELDMLNICTSALRDVPYLPYTQLEAARERFLSLSPIVAASMFMTGWEQVQHRGDMLAFRRQNNMVPDELLDLLPELDVIAIGGEAMRLMQVTQADEKN